jgi:hypothetical protein
VAKLGVHAHIEVMASRPCKPDADLKGLWRVLLGTQFPVCGVPADDDADSGESAAAGQNAQTSVKPSKIAGTPEA